MSVIAVPTKEQVDEKSQAIFDVLKGKLGMVPNLYAVLGYSSNALESFLGFSGVAGKDVFSAKEVEAIKLVVSQVNGCDYCQAAHTTLGKMNGLTEDETVEIRKGTITDNRLNIITTLAKEIALDAGRASEQAKKDFFELGFKENALAEIVSVVISVTYTNYLFGLTNVPIDFPAAKSVSEDAVAA
ncbi:MAG: carboxymuconolactone decarboxylase family protein [Reichenbachiella sp.]